jgi:hypothetical protein
MLFGWKCQYPRSGFLLGAKQLTPGVGLITTLGGSLELPFGLELEPNLSCWAPAAFAWSPVELGGRGLLRISLTAVEEDVGVNTGDWFDESRPEGEAVPSLESLFFLEDLVASLPRESWR